MPSSAVIVAAKRTAIAKFCGSFSALPATRLGATAIAAILAETGLDPAQIDDVLIGQVLQAGAGQNPARQSARHAGHWVSIEMPDQTVVGSVK